MEDFPTDDLVTRRHSSGTEREVLGVLVFVIFFDKKLKKEKKIFTLADKTLFQDLTVFPECLLLLPTDARRLMFFSGRASLATRNSNTSTSDCFVFFFCFLRSFFFENVADKKRKKILYVLLDVKKGKIRKCIRRKSFDGLSIFPRKRRNLIYIIIIMIAIFHFSLFLLFKGNKTMRNTN